MILFYLEFELRASNVGSNLVAHKFKQKVLNICENSQMVNYSNFWYFTQIFQV
jgi:hypothetical protein